MADYLWANRPRLAGTSIVELGAGIGLPGMCYRRTRLVISCDVFVCAAGIVAAIAGAKVTLTDVNEPHILDNLRINCAANNVTDSCSVVGLPWGCPTPQAARLRASGVDIIIAADCLYESSCFAPFFATAAYLLSGRRGSELLTAFQVGTWNLSVVKSPHA